MSKGFTLIELMIVVAIVAILAAVAVPAYQQYVEEGRRGGEGMPLALDIADRQFRHFSEQQSFATQLTGTCDDCLNMPSDTSQNGSYQGSTTGGSTFTVTVTPILVPDTECGELTITNTGVKGSEYGDPVLCWR